MMMMLFLFPLAVLGGVVMLVADLVKERSVRRARRGPALLVAGLLASYVTALILLSSDPYFDDNGSPSFIEMRYRFVWAAEIGGWLALAVVPALFALRGLLGILRSPRSG